MPYTFVHAIAATSFKRLLACRVLTTTSWRRLGRWQKLAVVLALLAIGPFFLPEHARIPVEGATSRDWNPQSFWYQPWGTSGVHKGIDVFAPHGRAVIAPTAGLVVYRGTIAKGGNVVLLVGPKWRLHYFAHLGSIDVEPALFVRRGTQLGTIGNSGNAVGKPPHLHYTVASLLPRPWAFSTETQGWKRMYFMDPATVIK